MVKARIVEVFSYESYATLNEGGTSIDEHTYDNDVRSRLNQVGVFQGMLRAYGSDPTSEHYGLKNISDNGLEDKDVLQRQTLW